MLYLGIYVRRFFNAGWSCRKLVSGGSLGGPGGSENRSWRGPGAPRRWPRGSKNGFGRGKGAQERPRRILEPSWVQKRQDKGGRGFPFGTSFSVFAEALTRLGGAFLSDLIAHRFCIIFYRFWNDFGMIFATNLEAKRRRN